MWIVIEERDGNRYVTLFSTYDLANEYIDKNQDADYIDVANILVDCGDAVHVS